MKPERLKSLFDRDLVYRGEKRGILRGFVEVEVKLKLKLEVKVKVKVKVKVWGR